MPRTEPDRCARARSGHRHIPGEAKEAKTEEDVINVILDNTQQLLQQVPERLETQSLAQATEILKSASRIWITGEAHLLRHRRLSCQEPLPHCGIPAAYLQPSTLETAAVVAQR